MSKEDQRAQERAQEILRHPDLAADPLIRWDCQKRTLLLPNGTTHSLPMSGSEFTVVEFNPGEEAIKRLGNEALTTPRLSLHPTDRFIARVLESAVAQSRINESAMRVTVGRGRMMTEARELGRKNQGLIHMIIADTMGLTDNDVEELTTWSTRALRPQGLLVIQTKREAIISMLMQIFDTTPDVATKHNEQIQVVYHK